ncbi:MAG: endonuclease [Sphingobacteriales bacterium]|nr:MAG: endonuclease [Sphingobacteriales bacterium]
MSKHNETGALGETLAAEILAGKGYQVHFRNWRSGKKEVDLIASFDNQWIFVEVKTRQGTAFGFPEDFVDARKKAHLRSAAEAFLWDHTQFPTLRYDIISIILNPVTGAYEWTHFEDAFY